MPERCTNLGCGIWYDPENNTEGSCCYHPGEPYFHDTYKYWTCCNKKAYDFPDFLKLKGCAFTKHSNVEPVYEKPKKEPYKDPPMIYHYPKRVTMKRPPIDTIMTIVKPTVDNALKNLEYLQNKMQKCKINTETVDKEESIRKDTSCKNKCCSYRFTGTETDNGECLHHPGEPVFHEGMKFWSCCQKKTTDFFEFMSQMGCTYGKHKWIDDKKKTVECRHDWHQTSKDVVVSIYAKKYDYTQTIIEVNPIRLYVKLVFPEQDNACYELDLELGGVIDVNHTSAHMFSTKVEITMRKVEPFNWLLLYHKEGIEDIVFPSQPCPLNLGRSSSDSSLDGVEQLVPTVPRPRNITDDLDNLTIADNMGMEVE